MSGEDVPTTPAGTGRLPHEPEDGPSDRALVERANGGERAAFAVLYERHREWMTAVAYRLTSDPSQAEDVVHAAVLHWLERFPGFVLTAPVRAYLYPVLRHLAIDRARTGRRHASQPLDQAGAAEAADSLSISSAVPSLEDARDVDEALGRLPLGQREVLLLHFGDGLTLGQVAAALEVPLGTVKSRLGLALAALRTNDALRRLVDPRG